MSEYDRRTGVKRLRVRGYKPVRFCATLKALGINILRAAAVLMALNRPDEGKQFGRPGINSAFSIFKEQFSTIAGMVCRLLHDDRILKKRNKVSFSFYDNYVSQC